jgi:hypothetical protein
VNSPIVKVETTGASLSGIPIPLITITDFTCKSPKKTILMNGRMHPGETHASWVFHGLIHFLLSKQDVAKELRKRVVFKLVPILNIDGVIGGNYRTSFAGVDINRMFGENANKRLNPESTKLKELALTDKRTTFYFDLHGHSSKKSVFMYGPHFPLHSEHYMKIRVLPKLLQQRSEMFRYFSCRFANEASKRNCSRLVISRALPLPNCYTIEISMMAFLNKERQTIDLDCDALLSFGSRLCRGLLDWFQMIDKHKMERIKRVVHLESKKKPQRTIVDILGTEDCEEYKNEIDIELKKVQQQQLAAGSIN